MESRRKPVATTGLSGIWGLIERSATDTVQRTISAGGEVYDRRRHLPRVLPVGPEDLADETVTGRRRLLARLARALRAERNRGRAGHWTYDLNRHLALNQAYVAERAGLRPAGMADPMAEKQSGAAQNKPPPVSRRRSIRRVAD